MRQSVGIFAMIVTTVVAGCVSAPTRGVARFSVPESIEILESAIEDSVKGYNDWRHKPPLERELKLEDYTRTFEVIRFGGRPMVVGEYELVDPVGGLDYPNSIYIEFYRDSGRISNCRFP